MTGRARYVLMILAALILAPAAFRLAASMPTFGAHPLPYGDAINDVAPKERKVTNTVTAVNFDYRGFDTLGEEFMLLPPSQARWCCCAARAARTSRESPGWWKAEAYRAARMPPCWSAACWRR